MERTFRSGTRESCVAQRSIYVILRGNEETRSLINQVRNVLRHLFCQHVWFYCTYYKYPIFSTFSVYVIHISYICLFIYLYMLPQLSLVVSKFLLYFDLEINSKLKVTENKARLKVTISVHKYIGPFFSTSLMVAKFITYRHTILAILSAQ